MWLLTSSASKKSKSRMIAWCDMFALTPPNYVFNKYPNIISTGIILCFLKKR